MLDAIRKKFSKQPSGEKVEMTKTTLPDMALETQLAAALSQITNQQADFQALTEMVEELSAKFEASTKALAASELTKASLVAEASVKRLKARSEAITKAVGTSKLESLMTATENLADAQFEAIVSAMAASFDAEAKSPMFQEAGVGGETKVIVEQDSVTKLAAAITAKINQNK